MSSNLSDWNCAWRIETRWAALGGRDKASIMSADFWAFLTPHYPLSTNVSIWMTPLPPLSANVRILLTPPPPKVADVINERPLIANF